MSKKVIAIITTISLILTMIVPAMAGSGDNTGDDTFPCSVGISNSTILGEYTLGKEKIFKISTYSSGSEGAIVNRKIEITGESQVSGFEFLDGDTWKDISGFNTKITLANDVDRQVRVIFNEAGIYTIRFSLFNTNGTELAFSQRVVSVSSDGIELYKESETTAEVTTTAVDTTTTEATTAETTIDETTTSTPAETTTVEPKTQALTAVATTTEASEIKVKVAKARVKEAVKKKSAKKVKISLKKLKGVRKYQIQISKAKTFNKKNILVKKNVNKVKFTIKYNKFKNKKKLYVRARAIKVVNGKTYYGKWSKKKRIKLTK